MFPPVAHVVALPNLSSENHTLSVRVPTNGSFSLRLATCVVKLSID